MLSESILRDEYGQHTLDPLPALKRKLGERYELTMNEERSFRKIEIVGGFNRKWGLPLPQVNAIAAGSVFWIKADPGIEAQTLKNLQSDLQTNGLGDRRVDGFGRVAIEWYSDNPKRWQKEEFLPSKRGDIQHTATLSQKEEALAELMLRRMLKRELDDSLQTAVGKLTVKGEIPNSQLSRWRNVVHSALSKQSTDELLTFIEHEEEKRSPAWEKMRRAKVKRNKEELGRLTEWIKAVLDGKGSPWSQLDCPNNEPPRRSLGKVAVRADDQKISTEYRLRLIDALLNRIAKGKANPDNEGGKNA
jgi:CRISPR-associated protein Csx10